MGNFKEITLELWELVSLHFWHSNLILNFIINWLLMTCDVVRLQSYWVIFKYINSCFYYSCIVRSWSCIDIWIRSFSIVVICRWCRSVSIDYGDRISSETVSTMLDFWGETVPFMLDFWGKYGSDLWSKSMDLRTSSFCWG